MPLDPVPPLLPPKLPLVPLPLRRLPLLPVPVPELPTGGQSILDCAREPLPALPLRPELLALPVLPLELLLVELELGAAARTLARSNTAVWAVSGGTRTAAAA